MKTSNVIELYPNIRPQSSFDYAAYERRANARTNRRNLVALAEAIVTAAIGVGFSLCLVVVTLIALL